MFEQLEGIGLRRWIANYGLPFVFASIDGKYTPNWTRIVEALIIAGITAFATSYITISELEVKLDYAKGDSARIERRVERNEIYMMGLMEKINSRQEK